MPCLPRVFPKVLMHLLGRSEHQGPWGVNHRALERVLTVLSTAHYGLRIFLFYNCSPLEFYYSK